MLNKHLISHGFTPVTTIQDLPVRGKSACLHIRRWKWLGTSGNAIKNRQYGLDHNMLSNLFFNMSRFYLAQKKGSHRRPRDLTTERPVTERYKSPANKDPFPARFTAQKGSS